MLSEEAWGFCPQPRLRFSQTTLWVIIKIEELASDRLRLSSLLAVFSSWGPIPSAGVHRCRRALFSLPSPADRNELSEGREGKVKLLRHQVRTGTRAKQIPVIVASEALPLAGWRTAPKQQRGRCKQGRLLWQWQSWGGRGALEPSCPPMRGTRRF